MGFGKRKSSIFKTTLEGKVGQQTHSLNILLWNVIHSIHVQVGVMNSGRTPTEIRDRKRHLFDTEQADGSDED